MQSETDGIAAGARGVSDALLRLRGSAAHGDPEPPEVWAALDLLSRIGVDLPAVLDRLLLAVDLADRTRDEPTDLRVLLREASDRCMQAGVALEQARDRLAARPGRAWGG